MGKAFTSEEKEQIRIRILEAGVKLFHENNVKALSISEITKRAGISQGGFYSFYKNKDDLIMAIMDYRSRQKYALAEKTFGESLKDPRGYLAQLILFYLKDLQQKGRRSQLYKDSFTLFLERWEKTDSLSDPSPEFLEKLQTYWDENGIKAHIDIPGMVDVLSGATLLFCFADKMEEQAFDRIIKVYLDAEIKEFIRLGER